MAGPYVVIRPAPLMAGVVRGRGEVVDPTGWRNLRMLIENRYLERAEADLQPVACDCGRLWMTKALAEAHECLPAAERELATAGPSRRSAGKRSKEA